VIWKEVGEIAPKLQQVDVLGLDALDRRFLLAIVEKFDGGPVGLETIAATLGQERDTLEDVVEPVLCELLSSDYECVPACSAEEALTTLRQGHFNLIISDIMMGGISGLEMLPHVLAEAPEMVVLMISGVQTIESAIKALRAGA